MPVPTDLAAQVLKVPAQLEEINAPGGDAETDAPAWSAARATIEALAVRSGKADDHDVWLVPGQDGKDHAVLAPSHFTLAQVFAQVDEKVALNSWSKFEGYCADQLQAQSRNEVYPREFKEWALGTLAGVVSFPLLALLLGAFVGWVWRGFSNRRTT